MTDLVDFATAAGASAEAIPRKEGWALLQAWREIYCAPVHAATGKWAYKGGLSWYTFSCEFFPSHQGKRALKEYNARSGADLLVMPEGGLSIRCTSSKPIDFSKLQLDLYVTPPSYEWTMAFTHEIPWLGPYFAEAQWRDGIGPRRFPRVRR